MNDVPLIKGVNINDINSSIIAIKKQLKAINEAVGLIDVPDIDTSVFVKKSEVANVVESGNLNPVTSNAVAINNKFAEFDYSGTPENPMDILSIASSIPDSNFSKTVSIRVVGSQTNSPYGAGVLDCDFHYDIKRISYNPGAEWIRIIAYDIRDNHIYEIAKINGTWQGWFQLQRVERADVTNCIISDALTCEWASLNHRDGVYNLYGRFYQTSAITISDGAVIGHLRADYYMNPVWGFPVNVHNFQNGQDYLLFFETDGTIKIYGIGTQTITFDFYFNTTYVR